jgi:hypothetical protein
VDAVLHRLSAEAGRWAGNCQPLRQVITVILTTTPTSPDQLVDVPLDTPLDDARDRLGVLTWRARQHAAQLGIPLDATRSLATDTSSGQDRPAGLDEPVYTTPDLFATERQALQQAAEAVATVGCHPAAVDQAIAGCGSTGRRAGRHDPPAHHRPRRCPGRRRRAGAGKTTALAVAVPLWRQSGCAITGGALAARTAQQLGDHTLLGDHHQLPEIAAARTVPVALGAGWTRFIMGLTWEPDRLCIMYMRVGHTKLSLDRYASLVPAASSSLSRLARSLRAARPQPVTGKSL